MGDAAIVFRVMSEDPNNIDNIIEEIKKMNHFNKVDIEDIGFGIKAAKVSFIVDDKKGDGSDKIEQGLKNINGVSQVDVLDVTLIS